ncbi:MAG: diguanylate cyclase [Campylobacterota bacterium]|nr:diguanylate cyclase [Campylobacterota bacterium]
MKKLIFFILITTIIVQAQTKKISLALPWKHQFQFAGYYVAKELGYYADAGLDVSIKEYDLSLDNTKEVSSHKYDFGVGHSSLILEKINDYDNIIFLNAIYQSSPFVLLSTKYKSLKEISGKKIMMSNDQTVTASINAMLYSHNLKQNSYITIETSFEPTDLINGNADFMASYSSNEPYTLNKKGVESFILDPKDYGYYFYSDILFTSKEMIQNNKKVVDNFRLASLRGWKYAFENIDEAAEIILKYYNTQGRTKAALIFEANTLKKLAFMDDVNFGNINHEQLKEIATTYRLLGLIDPDAKVKIDFKTFIYSPEQDYNFILKSKKDKANSFLELIQTTYFKSLISLLFLIIFISLFFKKRTEKLLKEQAYQLKLQNEIFNLNIASCTTDLDGKITYVSQAFCDTSGYTKDELISNTHNIIKDKRTPDAFYKDLWLTIISGHTWEGEFKNIKKDGSSYQIQAVITPLFDKKGEITGYKAIAKDITLEKVLKDFNKKLEEEVKKKTAKLEKLASTDKLTGVYNRVKLDEDVSANYSHFTKHNENFSIIIIDIDKFKDVNDIYGHQVGDIILKEVTQQIQKNIRSTDTLGRWGGEEFMVICPKSDYKIAYIVAQKIRKSIESHDFSKVGKITASSGVYDIELGQDIQTMINHADTLLYDVKKSGRNNVGQPKAKK